jgi:hypothetical protein
VEIGYGELVTSTPKAGGVDVHPIQSTVNHSNIWQDIDRYLHSEMLVPLAYA